MERGRVGVLVAAVVTVVASLAAVIAAVSSNDGDGEVTTSTGPAATTAPGATAETVEIADFAFAPAELTVSTGTPVTWTNADGVAHSIRAEDGSFESPDFDQGGTFSFVFNEPGTYAYVCGIHDSMRGTVVVE